VITGDNMVIIGDKTLIPLGTPTRYGRVVGVHYNGERYYFMMEGNNQIALMPATILEVEYGMSKV